MTYCLFMESLKNDTNDLFIRQKQTGRDRKQTYGYQRGKRDKLGFGD